MFFYPVWIYLKALSVTLIVEVSLFAFIISKKPLKILAATSFNVTSHILLHLFFTLMVRTSFGYNVYIYFIGEAFVIILEALLYYFSKIIPELKKAFLWSFLFNLASILVGRTISLLLF